MRACSFGYAEFMKVSPIWKIMLAVWSPVLAAGLIYGAVYLIRYVQTNREYSKDRAEYAACMRVYGEKYDAYIASKQVISGWTYFKGSLPRQDCYALPHIKSGFLGIPDYGVK